MHVLFRDMKLIEPSLDRIIREAASGLDTRQADGLARRCAGQIRHALKRAWPGRDKRWLNGGDVVYRMSAVYFHLRCHTPEGEGAVDKFNADLRRRLRRVAADYGPFFHGDRVRCREAGWSGTVDAATTDFRGRLSVWVRWDQHASRTHEPAWEHDPEELVRLSDQ